MGKTLPCVLILTLAPSCYVDPSTEQSHNGSYPASEQAPEGSGATMVSLNGGDELSSHKPIYLTVSEQRDGSASWSLSFYTVLHSPAAEIAISVRSYTSSMTQATVQSDAEATLSLDGATHVVESGTVDIVLDGEHASLHLTGTGSDATVLNARVSGTVSRRCFADLHQEPRATASDGTPSFSTDQDLNWSSAFCQAQQQEHP